jgi:EmrB/QacA subfamily drug resistance transporter
VTTNTEAQPDDIVGARPDEIGDAEPNEIVGGGRWRWLAFSAALAAMMMDLLDATIASVAGPVIQADLGGSYADLQWIAAAYTLAMAVGLLTGGRLGDMFGRKRMLLVGVTGFTIASVACAAAPSIEALIAGRVLQGGLGAVMVPQVFGLIRDLFAPHEMGKAWGILGPVSGLSAVLGPIVAGLLIDADLLGSGWRMIFLVNVPVGAFVLIAGAKYLPAVAPATRSRRLDLVGVALAAAGTLMLVYPLVQGRELDWPLWVLALLAGSLPVLALFARHQVRRQRAGAAPLVEPSVFANRAYVSGVAFAVVFLGAMGGMMLTLTVVLQAGLGYSPIEASLASAPYALGGFAGSAFGGAMMHKLGRRILHAGLVLKAAGFAVLGLVFQSAGADIGSWDFAAPLLVSGIGMGMVFVPLFDIVLAGVADHEVGSAAGVLQAMQQLGMSLGVAVVGTVFFGLLGRYADRTLDFVSAAETTALITVGLLALAFAIGFLLPRHARGHETAAGADETPGAGHEPAAGPDGLAVAAA